MTRDKQRRAAAHDFIKNNPPCRSYDAFRKGAEWADTHPYWISVTEQLPPKEAWGDEFITGISIDVLATDGKTIHMCFYDHNLKRWLYGDFWQLDNITHWMPIPQAPKKGGEE